MKARAFALMIFAVLCLAAALMGTVSATDNCCFVDRQCHSDRDWADGYYAFQNNQCPAPAQSQPVASAPPVGSAAAQVDNCCDVDRQCSSELQWIAGWHAYQNGQCGAPGASPASSSYQPAGGVILRAASGIVMGDARGRSILPSTRPSNLPTRPGQSVFTNNCCQDQWQCNSDQDWAAGYHAFHNDCGLPGLISIVGEPDFVNYYQQMLEVLKNRSPHRYGYVLDGLDKIEQRQEFGGRGVISSGRRTFFMHWNGPADEVWGAGWDSREPAVLVHEACHAHRSNAGHHIYQCDHEAWTREEVFCRSMELEVLNELGAASHVIEWVRDNLAETRTGKPSIEFMTYGGNCQA